MQSYLNWSASGDGTYLPYAKLGVFDAREVCTWED